VSVVQKVIILNKPLKVFEFTPVQLVLLVVSTILALIVGGKIPGTWKIGNLPAGFLIGLLIVCAAIVFVKATEIKPMQWWRNLLFYRLKLTPTRFVPHPEPANVYPDTTIIDGPKKVTSEFFIVEDRPKALSAVPVSFEDDDE
jgi:hypothetical protein